jgi:hypothetical protein
VLLDGLVANNGDIPVVCMDPRLVPEPDKAAGLFLKLKGLSVQREPRVLFAEILFNLLVLLQEEVNLTKTWHNEYEEQPRIRSRSIINTRARFFEKNLESPAVLLGRALGVRCCLL